MGEPEIEFPLWPAQDELVDMGESAGAAAAYAILAQVQINEFPRVITEARPTQSFRWPREFWQPSPDPAGNLRKAALLIAAEISRLTGDANG